MGRFVPWAVLCLGSFYAMGRSVPWVVLSRGSFWAWAVLSLGRFEPWAVLRLGRFELGPFREWAGLLWTVLYVHRYNIPSSRHGFLIIKYFSDRVSVSFF
jgi:hypothetical protein